MDGKVKKEIYGLRTWVEIDTEALSHNFQEFKKIISSNCKLMAVAKSNAYGHGLVDYSKTMEKLGADWIGVDSITEALRLRREGVKAPILVLGFTLSENFEDAFQGNISITVSNFALLESIKKFLQTIEGADGTLVFKLHIKIDTGMHRQGFQLDQVDDLIKEIRKIRGIEIEGLYTHFAAAKNPAFPDETNEQMKNFEIVCAKFKQAGIDPIKHAAATSGAIVFPKSHFDMVRIGIGMMGLWPAIEVQVSADDKMKLIPALSWKTIVAEVKEIKKGERVSYNFTETLSRDSKIAILPIGYWHGFRRNLSSIGQVIINGRRARVLGRVTMDMIVVDVTDIKGIEAGSDVILIGRDGGDEITAYEMAKLSDTSWYETITCLNPLIKRVYQ
ncbi:MAG: alanine racemase [Patescibacteria group bacterium]